MSIVVAIRDIRAIRGFKIFSIFSNFGRQILEKDGERKNDQFKNQQ
jgi:hypothetical protein